MTEIKNETDMEQTVNERNTMRFILAVLVKECGQAEGHSIFEWYCRTYGVDIASEIPATVRREVLGC